MKASSAQAASAASAWLDPTADSRRAAFRRAGMILVAIGMVVAAVPAGSLAQTTTGPVDPGCRVVAGPQTFVSSGCRREEPTAAAYVPFTSWVFTAFPRGGYTFTPDQVAAWVAAHGWTAARGQETGQAAPVPALTPAPNTPKPPKPPKGNCHPAYRPCVPLPPSGNPDEDWLNCESEEIRRIGKPIRVPNPGYDPYGLDDGDGRACELE